MTKLSRHKKKLWWGVGGDGVNRSQLSQGVTRGADGGWVVGPLSGRGTVGRRLLTNSSPIFTDLGKTVNSCWEITVGTRFQPDLPDSGNNVDIVSNRRGNRVKTKDDRVSVTRGFMRNTFRGRVSVEGYLWLRLCVGTYRLKKILFSIKTLQTLKS